MYHAKMVVETHDTSSLFNYLEFAVFILNNQIHTLLHNNNAYLVEAAVTQIYPRFPNYLGPALVTITRSVILTMCHTARATSSMTCSFYQYLAYTRSSCPLAIPPECPAKPSIS